MCSNETFERAQFSSRHTGSRRRELHDRLQPVGPDSPSTLVEFRLTALDTGTTELRVTETGFDSLPGDASERRTRFEENSRGWTTELEIAKHHLEKDGSVARR
ncbi:hypothetical protein NWP13_01000 [Rhodococcus pyridinivorans]|nr:hypothetical protein [Rhodococcus pyridinivorans]